MNKFLSSIASILGIKVEDFLRDNAIHLTDEQKKLLITRTGVANLVEVVNAKLGEANHAESNPSSTELTDSTSTSSTQGTGNVSTEQTGTENNQQGVAGTNTTEGDMSTDAFAAVEARLEVAALNSERERELQRQVQIAGAGAPPSVQIPRSTSVQSPLFDSRGLFPDQSDGQLRMINSFSVARPWNTTAKTMLEASTRGISHEPQYTEFRNNQPVMEQLISDLKIEVFLSNTNAYLKSIGGDMRSLPSSWRQEYGLVAGQMYGKSKTGSITQARKRGWRPSNVQQIEPEVVRMNSVQIDVEYEGFELQNIERNWLSFLNSPQGSASPFKPRFTQFLLAEIRKRQMVDDNLSSISGCYCPTPDGKRGRTLNSMDGVLYLIWQARGKKYRPFVEIGLPTESNIVDYIEEYHDLLPLEIRQGMELVTYMPLKLINAYRRHYALLWQKQDKDVSLTDQRYSNLRFEALPYEMGDFIFTTTLDNIYIANGPKNEETRYNINTTSEPRVLKIFADYDKGPNVECFGMNIKEDSPITYNDQLFWSNNADIPFAPTVTPPNATALDAKWGPVMQVGVNTQATSVANIENARKGALYTIIGAGATNCPTITTGSGSKFKGYESSYVLSEGVTISVLVVDENIFQIIDYVPPVIGSKVIKLTADAQTVDDPHDGYTYETTANTSAVTFTGMSAPQTNLNGTIITLRGGTSTVTDKETSLSTVPDHIVMQETVKLTVSKSQKMMFQNGIWYQIN